MLKMNSKREEDESPTHLIDYETIDMNTQKSVLAGMIPPPLPILPRQVPEYEKPKCPIDHIKFM
jgi:hypothetical protein